MNERIKLLAKEAGLWRQHYDIGEESPERLENFAELIVRECALVVHKKIGPKSALNVLEHFGVEE